jgi:hypothetical protein
MPLLFRDIWNTRILVSNKQKKKTGRNAEATERIPMPRFPSYVPQAAALNSLLTFQVGLLENMKHTQIQIVSDYSKKVYGQMYLKLHSLKLSTRKTWVFSLVCPGDLPPERKTPVTFEYEER